MTTRNLARISIVLVLGVLLSDHAASADDDPATKLQALTETIKTHRADGDLTALKDDIKALEALFAEADGDAATQKDVIKRIGSLSRPKKPNEESSLVQAALLAIARLGDQGGAKYVQTYLKQPNAKETPKNLATAMKAAGMLHCDSFVSALLKIVERSKLTGPATGAMRALAKFGNNKRSRKKILKELLNTVKKDKPGSRPADRSQAAANNPDPNASTGTAAYGGSTDRWNALSPVLPSVLNELTGETFSSVDEWASAYKTYKRDLDRLFSNVDADAKRD